MRSRPRVDDRGDKSGVNVCISAEKVHGTLTSNLLLFELEGHVNATVAFRLERRAGWACVAAKKMLAELVLE
jgi:hypothetical protein